MRVYLAGPPFAEEYRRRAAALVRAAGWEPVDPMRRDFRGATEGHEQEIVEGDLADIDSCDAVLAAFTAPDEGTAMEAWYAHAPGRASSPTRAERRCTPGRGSSRPTSVPISRPPSPHSGRSERLERAEQPLDVRLIVVGRDRDPQQAFPLPLAHDDLDPVLVEEPPLQLLRCVGANLGRPHLRRRCRAARRQPVVEGSGEPAAVAEVEPCVRLDRGRDRQRGRGVPRALPPVPVGEGAIGTVAPRDRRAARSSVWCSGRAQRNPAPFGAQSHLWQLPA